MKGKIKTAEKKATSEYKRKNTREIEKMSRREEDTENRDSTTTENGFKWSKHASSKRKLSRTDNKHDWTGCCFQEMHFNPCIIQHTCWRGEIIFCINSTEDGRGRADTRTTKENLLQEQMMEHYTNDVTDPPAHCRKDSTCTRQQPPNVCGTSIDGTEGRNQQSYNDSQRLQHITFPNVQNIERED